MERSTTGSRAGSAEGAQLWGWPPYLVMVPTIGSTSAGGIAHCSLKHPVLSTQQRDAVVLVVQGDQTHCGDFTYPCVMSSCCTSW